MGFVSNAPTYTIDASAVLWCGVWVVEPSRINMAMRRCFWGRGGIEMKLGFAYSGGAYYNCLQFTL